MKKAEVFRHVHHTVGCPHCGKDAGSQIDHLMEEGFRTQWYCNHCGGKYKLDVEKGGEQVQVQALDERIRDCAILLKYEGAYVVARGMLAVEAGEPADMSAHEYFYNEHACPTNWMKDVLCLYDSAHDDTDPHGMFEYVGSELMEEDQHDCNYDWRPFIERQRRKNYDQN